VRFSDFPQQQKAFLVVSSRNGDTHLDKMSTQISSVGHLYNNSSTFIDPSDLPFRLHVQLQSARSILFRAFSDLICLRRLDLVRVFLSFSLLPFHSACAHWDLGEREEKNLGI